MVKRGKRLDLQWQILIGIALGLVLGLSINIIYGSKTDITYIVLMKETFHYGGDIFIRLLRMSIIPLIFASLFMPIVKMGGDIKGFARIGWKTLVFYLVTTCLAVLLGLVLVNIIHPGSGIEQATLAKLNITSYVPANVATQGVGEKSSWLIIMDTLVSMIPMNPANALATGKFLQIIFFTIFFAIVTASVGKESKTIVDMVNGLNKIMHKIVKIIMYIAPYCLFFIVANIFMDLGFPALKALSKYGLTVLIGLSIHACVTLPILLILIGRYNPFKFLKAVSPALLTAWSTASSAATLPITMECVEERAGVDNKVGSFVLPLGATINMDGTALYESVAVIFIAQLMGFPLDFGHQVVIFITATLASIGAAAIPGAGLVTMAIVLSAVGLPLEGIGLILAIDRILDQFRTTINVWGDAIGAVVVGRLEGLISTPNKIE